MSLSTKVFTYSSKSSDKRATIKLGGANHSSGECIPQYLCEANENTRFDTVNSASMIEHLQNHLSAPNQIVLYFFCGAMNKDVASTESFLMSVALQFASRSPRCLELASQNFVKKEGRRLRIQEYLSLIDSFICEYDHVSILIDGIDEVEGHNHDRKREEKECLVDAIKQLCTTVTPNIQSSGGLHQGKKSARKILMTSREDTLVRANLVEQVNSHVCDLERDYEQMLAADLKRFISIELQKKLRNNFSGSKHEKLIDEDLQAEIESRILETGVT